MKWIKYKMMDSLYPVSISWNEANEQIAKQEAHNGEITPYEDGEAAAPVPTIEERINELTEAVNLLLEGAQE